MSERDERLEQGRESRRRSEKQGGPVNEPGVGQRGNSDGEPDRPPEAARRRKVPRWVIWAAAVVVIVIVGGIATLKLVFTPEKLRSMVEPRLEARINRDIEVGAVNLRLFPRLAIRLSDLTIANPADFRPEPGLAFDAVDVQVRLWPLLRKQLELGQVRLLGPVVRYQVLADGRTNFDDLTGGAVGDTTLAASTAGGQEGIEASGPEAAAAAAFAVQEFVVRDGRVYYSDGRTGRGASLSLEGRLSAVPEAERRHRIVSEGKFDLASIKVLAPQLGDDSVAIPNIEVGYEAVADLSGDSLELNAIEARYGDVALGGSGKVLGLRGDKSIALALESGEIDIANFILGLPAAYQPEAIEADGRARLSLRVSGPFGDGAVPQIDGTLGLEGISATYAEHGRLLRDGAGQATFDANSLSLPSFAGELLGRPFELRLAARDLRDPVVEGRFRGSFDIEELSKFRASETPAEGVMAVDVTFEGPVKQPGGLSLTGPVELTNLVYRSPALAVPAEVDTMTLQLTGAGVAAENIPIRLGDSDLTVSLSSETLLRAALNPETPPPLVQFTARSLRLNLSEIRADTFTVGYGQLVAARLAGKSVGGRDPGAIARERYPLPTMPPVEARGHVQIGEFINPPLRALNVAFDVGLRDGVITVEQLQSQVYGGRLTGGLSLDLGGGEPPFELEYDLNLAAAQAGAFLQSWTRLGSVASGVVDFDIRGSSPLDETLLPAPEAVAAAGQAAFREGSFANFGLTRELASKFKVDQDYVSAFRDLGGAFKIENGAFVVEEWKYTAAEWTAGISGSAGLAGTLDLNLAMSVPPSALERASLLAGGGVLGGLVSGLADSDEPLPVVLGVSGTITSPALEVDSQALQQALSERLGDSGKDMLRRLFRRPPPN